MANYNRTRLRSIDHTIQNSYLNSQGDLDTTYNLARTFSFRGRNCLSPIGDLENNNLVGIDSIYTGTGFTGGNTSQDINFTRDYINLNGDFLDPLLMKVFIGVSKKYVTPYQNGDFGTYASFFAPTAGTAGATYIVLCTPFGYQNFSFAYSNDAP